MKVGHKTFFSPIRRRRRIEFGSTLIHTQPPEKIHSSPNDSFCKLIKGEIPSIVITKDLSLNKDPFSTTPTNESLHSTTAFSTIHLYPPISRVVEKEASEYQNSRHPLGLSLIHIFTQHHSFPEEVSVEEWDIFLQNYHLTMKSCISHPTIRRLENITIHTFFNIGLRAGASIPHLHGQSLMFNPSGSGSKNASYTLASQGHNNCLKCQYWEKGEINFFSESISIKNRIIASNKYWMAFLAYAPEKDSHIRLLPRRHVSAFWLLDKKELSALAPIIIQCNKMLSNFIKREGKNYHLVKDRNIIVRQTPPTHDNHFHMFIDILPVQQLGGAEILDNQKFSSELPETIASKMLSLTLKDC